MNDINKVLSARRTLSMSIDRWERAKSAPERVRDRFMAVNHYHEAGEAWEMTETIVAESVSGGQPRDEYFLSLLVNCHADSVAEMNLGVGNFRRPGQPGNIIFGDAAADARFQGIGPFHSIAFYISKSELHSRMHPLLQRDQFSLEKLLSHYIRDEQLESSLKRLLGSYQNQSIRMHRESLLDVLCERLLVLSGNKISQSPLESLSRDKVDRVIDYMHAHLSEDLTLPQLAEVAGVSRSYFARLFHQTIGVPPARYLMSLRVEKAKDLLRSLPPDVPAREIAVQAGFSNRSHLSREFRKATGVTPEAYRRP